MSSSGSTSLANNKWWVLIAVGCGTFMATLDASIVNIGLPTLTKVFNTDLGQVKWVVIVYLLVITCLLLPFGRLSDQFGRKRIFQFGFAVFTVGSAFCGVAATLPVLILARILQGVGAAMLMANSPAIITATFPATERGKALGTMAMVVSAGLISGPSVGGFLITELGWRSIFLVNVPVGLLGLYLVQRSVSSDLIPREFAPFDWKGAILQSIFLTSFMFAFDPPSITAALDAGLGTAGVSRAAIAFVTLVSGILFFRVEKVAQAPLLDLTLLSNRTFWTANLASFLVFISYSSVSVLMPFYLEEVMALPPNQVGLLMTAIPLTIFVVAPISGRLSDRMGSQELSFLGALVGVLGLFFMAGVFGVGLNPEMALPVIVLALCSIGLATGLFQSPNNNAIMGAVPPEKLGVASALLATVRNLGLVVGTGLATGVFAWRQRVTGDYVSSLHFTHFIGGLVGIGAMLAALGKKRGPNWK